mgnify:CR=1 FL=1
MGEGMRKTIPRCPYCGERAKLTDSAHVYGGRSYGLIWDCRPCDAYVGVHKGTSVALGRLANAELRRLKIKAHAAFDPLWKSGKMKRTDAYSLLAERMNIAKRNCHVGMFDEAQCRLAISVMTANEAA